MSRPRWLALTPGPGPGRFARRLPVALGLALLVTAAGAAGLHLGWLRSLQARSADFLFVAETGVRTRATVIVGIDSRSHRELLVRFGPMVEWSRALCARAIQALVDAGARVIVFDLYFDAPQAEDRDLAATIRRAGNVLLPVEAQGPGRLRPAPGVAQEFDLFARLPRALRESAAGEGFTNVTTDRDSVVRTLPLLLRADGADVPALPLAAVAHYLRRPAVLDGPPTAEALAAAGRRIPLVGGGRLTINYLGPPASRGGPPTIPYVSFVDVVEGRLDPAMVRDRLVLVGLTLRGLDEFATPTTADTRMWGVELLAHAVETILQDRYLVPASEGATVATMALLALAGAALVARWPPLRATVGAATALLLYLVGAAVAFDHGLVANLVYPPLALAGGFGSALAYRVVFEEAEQRRLRETMGRYLSPTVSRWVLRDPERLRLGGQTRVMTVLFSDIRGFTTLSHGLDPQALVALLNEYMTAMTEIVFRHDGVLDKYIGDAVMAFWGAPVEQPDHARRACQAALDMVARLEELRATWAARGRPAIEAGIGINTGPMVVGNMGSQARLAYTVIGDSVNVASRLEGLSKEYGVRIVIGEATRDAAGPGFACRRLDRVAVKGREAPVEVYELVGASDALEPAARKRLEAYQAGLALYLDRRFEEAADAFRILQAEDPGDGPAALYRQRSEAFVAAPPPDDWEGVFVARSK
jgi:adenylate cyclase